MLVSSEPVPSCPSKNGCGVHACSAAHRPCRRRRAREEGGRSKSLLACPAARAQCSKEWSPMLTLRAQVFGPPLSPSNVQPRSRRILPATCRSNGPGVDGRTTWPRSLAASLVSSNHRTTPTRLPAVPPELWVVARHVPGGLILLLRALWANSCVPPPWRP